MLLYLLCHDVIRLWDIFDGPLADIMHSIRPSVSLDLQSIRVMSDYVVLLIQRILVDAKRRQMTSNNSITLSQSLTTNEPISSNSAVIKIELSVLEHSVKRVLRGNLTKFAFEQGREAVLKYEEWHAAADIVATGGSVFSLLAHSGLSFDPCKLGYFIVNIIFLVFQCSLL